MGGHCLFIPPKQHGGRALSVPIPQTERGAALSVPTPPPHTARGGAHNVKLGSTETFLCQLLGSSSVSYPVWKLVSTSWRDGLQAALCCSLLTNMPSLHGRFLNLMLPSRYLEKTFWKVFCFTAGSWTWCSPAATWRRRSGRFSASPPGSGSAQGRTALRLKNSPSMFSLKKKIDVRMLFILRCFRFAYIINYNTYTDPGPCLAPFWSGFRISIRG